MRLRLPLVGPRVIAELRVSKTKHTMMENQYTSEGANCLPLVGPGVITELRVSKPKRPMMENQYNPRARTASRWSASRYLQSISSQTHKLLMENQTQPAGSASCLPLVGPGTRNPIRKETLAAGSIRSRLQAHSSMRKC